MTKRPGSPNDPDRSIVTGQRQRALEAYDDLIPNEELHRVAAERHRRLSAWGRVTLSILVAVTTIVITVALIWAVTPPLPLQIALGLGWLAALARPLSIGLRR